MFSGQLAIRNGSMCNESDVSERAVANPIQKRGYGKFRRIGNGLVGSDRDCSRLTGNSEVIRLAGKRAMRRRGLPTVLPKRALKNFGPNKVALGQCAWNHRICPDLSHVIFSEVNRRPCLSLRPLASGRSPHLPQLSLLRRACSPPGPE
jgi:hypothetical protein